VTEVPQPGTAAPEVTLPGPAAGLRELTEVLGYLMHPDSLLALSVLAVILSLTEWVGTLPTMLAVLGYPTARLLWASYFLLVARKAALGSRRLPIPSDHIDTWDTLIQPLLQGLLATALSWGALLVYAAGTTGVADFVSRYQGHPLQFLADQRLGGHALIALWMVQVPAGVVAVLGGRRGLSVADPTLGLRLLRRTGAAWPITFATLCALALLGHAADIGASRLGAAFPVPLAGPVLAHLLQLWVPLAQARLLGRFVYRFGPWLEAQP
jgi:hypothetical protein